MLERYFFVTLSILFQISGFNVQADCVYDRLKSCENQCAIGVQKLVNQYISERRLPNEQFLDENCDKIKNVVQCMRNELKQCDDYGAELVLEFINKNISSKVCNKTSQSRKIYLKSLECYNSNIDKTIKCVRNAEDFKYEQYEMRRDETDENRVGYFRIMECLPVYMINLVCIPEIINKSCGDEAATLVKDLLNYAPFITNQKCRSKDSTNAIVKDFGESIDSWKKNGTWMDD